MRFLRRTPKAVLALSMLIVLSLFGTLPSAFSLPQGGQVEEGDAAFESPDSSTLNITTSNLAIINWNSFNIAQNETVNFYQPLSSSSVLNRILGGGISEIA